LSVGNYLRLNGWKKKLAKSHVPALMKYNNSKDYANAILKLAKFVDKGAERVPAATEESP
jgi:membrane-bound lytic murein transglycosylase B